MTAPSGTATTTAKMPWPQGVTGRVTQTLHTDAYGVRALDIYLPAGTPVLAPTDLTVVSQCNAGNNHRAIKLRDGAGRYYSLIHVTTSNISNGRTYRQGEQIGVVAGDRPWNNCAKSTGVHLHFGIPSNPTSVDGYSLGSSTPYNTNLASSNGGSANPIRVVNFSGRTAPGGVNVRSGPGLNFGVVRSIGGNQTVSFDAWTYGSTVNDIWAGTPDSRWYRIAGTNQWIASAVVWGNAPNSRPMP